MSIIIGKLYFIRIRDGEVNYTINVGFLYGLNINVFILKLNKC